MARSLSLLLFLAGAACIIAGLATGQGQAGIFVIFPFVAGSGWLFILGAVLLFLSVLAVMFAWLPPDEGASAPPGGQGEWRTDRKVGVLILIGPLPMVIASHKTLALMLLILGVALALTFLVVLPALW
ncbi:MAG TPA: DUF131 domain-containing protein [Thermoplasmatales archaeon]|nr:DUF131 domain-containing protein [Thermoplasmatales archaeon]